MVVLVRGAAFRTERGRNNRSAAPASDPQTIAAHVESLGSLRRHILEPAAEDGWAVEVIIDVHTHTERLRALLEGGLRDSIASPGISLGAMRFQPLLGSQMKTLLANLEFVLHASRSSPSQWRALLITRIDLRWKKRVRLPLPSQWGSEIIAPWRLDRRNATATAPDTAPAINDVLIAIPACRIAEFWRRLVRHVATPNAPTSETTLHWICSHPDFAPDFACGVRFLEPCVDATPDTSRKRNSLYAIIGRHEAATLRAFSSSAATNASCEFPNEATPLRPELRSRVEARCACAHTGKRTW